MEDFSLTIGEAAGATFNELAKGEKNLTELKSGLKTWVLMQIFLQWPLDGLYGRIRPLL